MESFWLESLFHLIKRTFLSIILISSISRFNGTLSAFIVSWPLSGCLLSIEWQLNLNQCGLKLGGIKLINFYSLNLIYLILIYLKLFFKFASSISISKHDFLLMICFMTRDRAKLVCSSGVCCTRLIWLKLVLKHLTF